MTKEVALSELVETTKKYNDDDVFRWFTLDDRTTLYVTFGEVRRTVRKEKDNGPYKTRS